MRETSSGSIMSKRKMLMSVKGVSLGSRGKIFLGTVLSS